MDEKTLEALYPEIVAGIRESAVAGVKAELDGLKLSAHKESVTSEAMKIVAEAKLPEKVLARVKDSLGKIEIKMETTAEGFKAEATKLIASEKEYLEALTKPVVTGNGDGSGSATVESFDASLEKAMA